MRFWGFALLFQFWAKSPKYWKITNKFVQFSGEKSPNHPQKITVTPNISWERNVSPTCPRLWSPSSHRVRSTIPSIYDHQGWKIYHIRSLMILLMKEIRLTSWYGKSRHLHGFLHPKWCRISSINSITPSHITYSHIILYHIITHHIMLFSVFFSGSHLWNISSFLGHW